MLWTFMSLAARMKFHEHRRQAADGYQQLYMHKRVLCTVQVIDSDGMLCEASETRSRGNMYNKA